MIPVLSVSEMRKIDELAIHGSVETGYSYMLKAGTGVYEIAAGMTPDRTGDIAVICGRGNNGGDGFVVARLLLEAGYHVMCFGLAHPKDLSGEAKIAGEQYLMSNGNFLLLDDAEDLGTLSRYVLIIDALLGTGVRGQPRKLAADIICAVNSSGIPVISIDTPSGLDNDTGIPCNPCVKANLTVAIGFPKTGAYCYPGKSFTGRYVVKAIGYPADIVKSNHSGLFLPVHEDIEAIIPRRKQDGSKFDHGIVCLMCGSAGMTGSALLSSNAALRTGCGMTHLCAPRSVIPLLSMNCIETVMHGLAENGNGSASGDGFDTLSGIADRSGAACIGPGISHNEDTAELVRRFVAQAKIPVVLDADGINAFRNRTPELKQRSSDLCITPHSGEWNRLFPALPAVIADKIKALKDIACEYRMTILYKGNPTIITSHGGEAWLLPYGNSGMATAGCGDVLAGIIASVAAQGAGMKDAALAGAYIHQAAGNFAKEKFGEYGMTASDILWAIPEAMKSLAGNQATTRY
jgi:ADP-dependent NAD(P)H-hydrate dehydratase / NAD(P)H-hydrate epimerase